MAAPALAVKAEHRWHAYTAAFAISMHVVSSNSQSSHSPVIRRISQSQPHWESFYRSHCGSRATEKPQIQPTLLPATVMHRLYFMLLMPLQVLTPSTTPAKHGSPLHARTEKTQAKSMLVANIGPRHQDCEYWHAFPEVKAWGGIPGIIRDARSSIDLAVSVRNGTTTEIGLLGPEELATLERR
ncbi:hypothetical protein CERZMDRAFT_94159 [Cercospora zeae-maydis SCOH1-5]|uniref:Uncharacterized protein n=1 Tax=Cercospora zeae-maydis SCOH1-5 TaxID=717836 RepID=A0A6A6FQL7_9PEZI|nr:hypothetical protein CERZMDRAFT_94159 [Cercospora zeae-maydis SCOH1-5]